MSFKKSDDLTKPPKQSKGEKTYEIVKKVVSATIPFAGVVEVFLDEVIKPPSQKRLENWITAIVKDIEELKKQFEKFQNENLQNNEDFISTFYQSLDIAKKTHNKEKHEALKYAVINSVLNETFDGSIKALFLSFIEKLTPWHLKLLKYLDDPDAWFRKNNMTPPELVISGSIWQLMSKAFPNLEIKIAEIIVGDLNAMGLLNIEKTTLNITMSIHGPYQQATTKFGRDFLEFITTYSE